MKKLLLTVILYMSSTALGHSATFNLTEELNEARRCVAEGLYVDAIEKYSELIELLEKTDDEIIIKLYNERGDLYFITKDYTKALNDFQKIPLQPKTDSIDEQSEILRALCGRMFSFEHLDADQEAEYEFRNLVKTTSSIQNRLNEVLWLNESPVFTFFTNRLKYRSNYKEDENLVKKVSLSVEDCQTQCAGYAVGASWACSRVPNVAIQFLCVGCIWGLERACNWCCKDEGFWEKCVKPLRRLLHDPEHPQNPSPHPFE